MAKFPSRISVCVFITVCFFGFVAPANILMITLGGTKSHKIPFWELARGLINRGHNITFINPFPIDFYMDGLEEVTPAEVVFYVRNFTNWDLLGPKMRGEDPVSIFEGIRYAIEVCDAVLGDKETQLAIDRRHNHYDLAILDGAYPECAIGIVNHLKVPFMYINTVAFYMGSISIGGSPTPYSMTPFFARSLTDQMTFFERVLNFGYMTLACLLHNVMVKYYIEDLFRQHLGRQTSSVYDTMKNVSFILQNGHHTVTYPRPYLPNVAEIGCIHCKPATGLPKDLENFVGDSNGFIYVSMGSSVKEGNMPPLLKYILFKAFAQLPYKVLWKWDMPMQDVPSNVKISRWLPQQDILAHPKIKAFVTHGGLLSMFETVYHGVPVVTIPVFCDHEANSAKAEKDGYAIKLNLPSITIERLVWAIKEVAENGRYRDEVRRRQVLFKDQKETPLERAVYWTEYVLRHKGAYHLQSPSRNLSWIQYYSLDVCAVYLLLLGLFVYFVSLALKVFLTYKVVDVKRKIN